MRIGWKRRVKSETSSCQKVKRMTDIMTKKCFVIGSGVSGLSAALYACNNGYTPMILEKNPVHGGYATNIIKDGFRFEMSLHFVGPAIREPLRMLGIDDQIELIDVKDTTRIDCEESCKISQFSYNDSAESYKKYLYIKYPYERDGIEKLFSIGKNIERVSDKIMIGEHPFVTLLSNPKAFQFFAKYGKKTGQQLLDDLFIDDNIKKEVSTLAILLGTPNESLSAIPYSQIATESYNRGAFFIHGGSQMLSDVLLSRIERCGGEISFNSPVIRMDIDDSFVKRLYIGKRVIDVGDGVNVVYCADMLSLVNNISKGTRILNIDINSLPIANSLNVIHLGLDIDVKKIGIDRSEYNLVTPKTDFNIAIYSNKDSSFGSNKTSVLTVSSVLKYEKNMIYDELNRVWPRITDHVVTEIVWTPNDFESWTWNAGGSFGGFQATPGLANKQIPHRTLIKNLYIAGQWTGMGAGYINSMIGGINAVNSFR